MLPAHFKNSFVKNNHPCACAKRVVAAVSATACGSFLSRSFFLCYCFCLVQRVRAFPGRVRALLRVRSTLLRYVLKNCEKNVWDIVSGRIGLEVTGEIKVKALKIHARGHVKVRWSESRNAGSNTAYTQNYTEEVEYFNHKDVLVGHARGKLFAYSFTTCRGISRKRCIFAWYNSC